MKKCLIIAGALAISLGGALWWCNSVDSTATGQGAKGQPSKSASSNRAQGMENRIQPRPIETGDPERLSTLGYSVAGGPETWKDMKRWAKQAEGLPQNELDEQARSWLAVRKNLAASDLVENYPVVGRIESELSDLLLKQVLEGRGSTEESMGYLAVLRKQVYSVERIRNLLRKAKLSKDVDPSESEGLMQYAGRLVGGDDNFLLGSEHAKKGEPWFIEAGNPCVILLEGLNGRRKTTAAVVAMEYIARGGTFEESDFLVATEEIERMVGDVMASEIMHEFERSGTDRTITPDALLLMVLEIKSS